MKHKVIKILWKYKYQKQSCQNRLWLPSEGGKKAKTMLAIVDNPGRASHLDVWRERRCVCVSIFVWSGGALCCQSRGSLG